MTVMVREMSAADRGAWGMMRAALWPEETAQAHGEWIDVILRSREAWGFMAEAGDGAPAGFAEVAIRKYANGCESMPVPFLEGVWVRSDLRRQGIGRALIEHVAAFLVARGFRELGSDSQIDNGVAHASHRSWGFSETERIVYFRKFLT